MHALHSRVEDHNRRCLEVTARLHDVLPLEEKALQLLALFVFDVSMLWHVAHMHVSGWVWSMGVVMWKGKTITVMGFWSVVAMVNCLVKPAC